MSGGRGSISTSLRLSSIAPKAWQVIATTFSGRDSMAENGVVAPDTTPVAKTVTSPAPSVGQ
jgi:hypothetical protein